MTIKRCFKICSLLLPLFLCICFIFNFFFKWILFSRAVLGSQQNWRKVQRFPLNLLLQLTFSHCQHSLPECYSYDNLVNLLIWHTIITWSPQFTLEFISDDIYYMDVDKFCLFTPPFFLPLIFLLSYFFLSQNLYSLKSCIMWPF